MTGRRSRNLGLGFQSSREQSGLFLDSWDFRKPFKFDVAALTAELYPFEADLSENSS